MSDIDWKWPWPLLRQGWPEDWDAQNERTVIMRSWHEHDRHVVKDYEGFLAARRLMEARIACASAIAGLRSVAADPIRLHKWHEDHEMWPTLTACRRFWGQSWGHNSGWGTGSGGWPGVRDPQWDGVTRVPKSPGKNKRRKQRAREHREEWAREEQHAGGWDD
ncbi:hypothetical protein B0H13DRAFT_2336690 [Mycena leptocephala]|nr:hypothetical protein B0H13DRAFT_2336690 [Mycena leptocephala]